jgi:hypothetical protein
MDKCEADKACVFPPEPGTKTCKAHRIMFEGTLFESSTDQRLFAPAKDIPFGWRTQRSSNGKKKTKK